MKDYINKKIDGWRKYCNGELLDPESFMIEALQQCREDTLSEVEQWVEENLHNQFDDPVEIREYLQSLLDNKE